MQSSRTILQAISDGQRSFALADFRDLQAFNLAVAELRSLNESGFLKGYREVFDKVEKSKVIQASVSHGLSEEGSDYLVRIGGSTLRS